MRSTWKLILGAGMLAVGAVLGLTVAMDTQALPNPWLREAYRVVFFHMPFAFAGTVYFMVGAAHAGRYLVTRNLRADRAALGSAELGLILLGLATVTGMIFARCQWGMWWNWDPRETSVFFVLLIYAAYLMLRQALPQDEALRARVSAAYLLLAVAPMIWLVAIFPRTAAQVSTSLHPVRPPLGPAQWRIIFWDFAGLLILGAWLRDLQNKVTEKQFALWESGR
ncbi:MAG: cytochrome c biogenesis protein CcsA [Armatimonadetes bacterium]|nr:cytochrome c biogenesis protein CcsA [Armatimonadota bacterium]